MKINYTKKRLKMNLILGLIWFSLGLVLLILNGFNSWLNYFWIIMAIISFGMYSYENRNQYLTIENGIIKVNNPIGKKINLTEIKRVKKMTGIYILKTDKIKLTINTQIIDPDSLMKLNSELEKLNVE